MLHIVTGNLDSGKSRFLIEHCQIHQGDGVVAVKVFKDHQMIGYDAYFVGQKQTIPLMRRQEALPNIFPQTDMIGPFYYDEETFKRMNEYLLNLLKNNPRPIYIDEIGRLELSGRGLDPVVKKGFEPTLEVYLVIRKEYLETIINHYQLKPGEIIDVGENHHA